MFAGAVLIMRGYCCDVLCRVARQRQVVQDAGLAFLVIDESQPDGYLRRQGDAVKTSFPAGRQAARPFRRHDQRELLAAGEFSGHLLDKAGALPAVDWHAAQSAQHATKRPAKEGVLANPVGVQA